MRRKKERKTFSVITDFESVEAYEKDLNIACTGPEPRGLGTNRVPTMRNVWYCSNDLKTHVNTKNEAEAGIADIESGSVPRGPDDEPKN